MSFSDTLALHRCEYATKPMASIDERYPDLDGNQRQQIVMRDYFVNDDAHLRFANDNGERLLERHPLNDRGDEVTTS